MLALLTSGEPSLADVLREVALVAVWAVPALDAGQALADAFVLVAVRRRGAGMQPAGDLGPRRTGRPALRFFAAYRSGDRALCVRRLIATHPHDQDDEEDDDEARISKT